ncbi:beta-phosphoglucomutase, HAD superfamily [Terrimicrobium sacchariphilum]|uniref:Beta-phosphoglucomutase, HAD superfamily n=1 Tax=Terrimicrobium sacchariphilum TaxID=690879 RepID=A0A146G5R9_TERSA|nr:HAD family phosphatase [Terrimicrobium sacchariphilum]GAT32314.1 beta-phosphoglucomutase, HAD superfamily [Terrimicrobium sacchariphilum]
MMVDHIPGIGPVTDEIQREFLSLEVGGDGMFRVGKEGVKAIFTPLDRVSELIVHADKTLVYIRSKMGYPALYPLHEARYEGPAEAVLMDLDGTSVHSEHFWIWVIEQTTARLLGNAGFQLEAEDEPHVSGHSVSEHLSYCIDKYCPDKTVEEARRHYFDIVHHEMSEIMAGRGRPNAFEPAPGLDEFLYKLKENGVKIGLVTSGLYEKAWPEVLSAFRTLKMGDPLEFYDAIISAGHAIRKGQCGTMGELAPKPHPWLYAETARVGLGIDPSRRHRVIGMEDSGAGVVSIRLAGFSAIGVEGGNIDRSGSNPFLAGKVSRLVDALPMILDK